MKVLQAATAYVTNDDGLVLCVWNRCYNGWVLPGGKVEEGETPAAAMERELLEETGLVVLTANEIYVAETRVVGLVDRGRQVHVFSVAAVGEARETEPGSPPAWLTAKEFLRVSPFRAFYKKMRDVKLGLLR